MSIKHADRWRQLKLLQIICNLFCLYSFRPIIAAKASCIQTDFHQAYHTSRINLNAWHTHSRTHTHTQLSVLRVNFK